MINLTRLEIFCAVVQYGSFSEAAQRLYLTQPSVSQQIKTLEKEWGVELFERHPRRVTLTEAGEVVYQFSREVLQSARDVRNILNEMKGAISGTISLGATRTLGSYLLPPLLSRFKREHPGAQILMRVSDTNGICADVTEGRIDLGIVVASEVPETLECEDLYEEELLIFGAPHLPIFRRHPHPLGEIARYPFVMPTRDSGFRSFLDKTLRELGLPAVQIAMEVGSDEAIKQAVETGLGLGILFASGIHREVEEGRLQVLPLEGRRLTGRIAFVHRPHKRFSPMVKELIQFIRQHVTQRQAALCTKSGPDGLVAAAQ